MHTVPNASNNAVIFKDDENKDSDSIFVANTNLHNYGCIVKPNINDDRDYNTPDTKRYIFTTMGGQISAMHINNMVTPVRLKSSINGFSQLNTNINKTVGTTIGVYIVDYFTINNYDKVNSGMTDILKYYLNTSTITYKLNFRDIAQNIDPNCDTYTFRVVSFIPEEDLIRNHVVYDENTDMVIVSGSVNQNIVHPKSKFYKNSKDNDISSPTKNAIFIDIVDNHNTEPYFMKIGNRVYRLLSRRDPTTKDEVSITVKSNDVIINGMTTNLENAEERIGIYETYQKAEANGDLELKHNVDKISLDKDKLEYEIIKLKSDMDLNKQKAENDIYLLENKLKIADIELKKKENELRLANEKGNHEITNLKTKQNHEIVMHDLKTKNNSLKSLLDTFLKLYIKIVI